MAGAKQNTVGIVTGMVRPITEELGLRLWDVRFEKEGSLWYLRVIIDKDGGVNINDCEDVSRRLSPILDEKDPIDHGYTLEVSSPGVGRELKKPEHFAANIGKAVHVRFIRPVEGERDFYGELAAFDGGQVSVMIDEETQMNFSLSETAFVKLDEEIDMGGLQ